MIEKFKEIFEYFHPATICVVTLLLGVLHGFINKERKKHKK